MPVLPLITDSAADLRPLLAAALAAGAEEAISQTLFLRTEAVHGYFLGLVKREFPWAARRYAELFPRPGSAPAAVRASIEDLVARLCREVGFAARSREARVREESPARPKQISLVW
jgi:hypothetical protein